MICHRPTASRQRGEYRQRPLSVSAHDSCTYVHKALYAPPSPSPPPQWGPPVSIPSQALIPDVVLPKYQCREINTAGPYGASSQRFKAQGLTVMKLFFSEKERGPGLSRTAHSAEVDGVPVPPCHLRVVRVCVWAGD